MSVAMGEGWTLHHGDCIAGMAALGDLSVDVVITDPPYDTHTHSSGRRGSSITAKAGAKEKRPAAAAAAFSRARDLGFDAITQEQMAEFTRQLNRIVKRWSLIFCTIEMVGDPDGIGWRGHGERAGLDYVRTAFWHKLGSTPQFTGDRPANAAEAIVIFHQPGRKRWNGGGRHGWYEHELAPGDLVRAAQTDPSAESVLLDWHEQRGDRGRATTVYTAPIVLERGHGEVRLHTTQKPLTLMRQLVEDFSEPGETVLDAFSGSGTTAVAATQLGRRFIGFELDASYFDIACRRLRGDEAKPRKEQPGLFDALAGAGR